MRKALFPTVVILSVLMVVARLFYLQVIDESFKLKSDNNAIKILYDYPERGYIYDRNGQLMVANQPSYDIMVTPKDVKNIDTTEFCNLLHITRKDFDKYLAKAKVYSPRLPSVFLAQLNKKEYAAFQEKQRKFPGFEIVKRSLRDYQINVGANVFGYIGQVSEKTIEENPYYNSGDLIGKQGVEQEYEKILRGVKGVKYRQRDKFNKDIGSYKNGQFDTIAKPGRDITLTIDAELQKYGEQLMVNKRGGIVVLEPKTGEILALVTAPSYDPSLLVGRQRSKNYTMLYNDSIAKPLFDRGLLAEYPPGSPFKIVTGLVALQEGAIDENTTFFCHHGFSYARGRFMRCHCNGGAMQLHNGIFQSCNTYFSSSYMRTLDKFGKASVGVGVWSKHVKSFGLGEFMGYDLPTGRKGKVPTPETYKKMYPNWNYSSKTIVSNAIGQGEISATPIQLANMITTVANQGYYYTPHIIKKVKGETIDPKFKQRHYSTINRKYFAPVISGLYDVYNFGTARGLGLPDIKICGKTGTAENFAKVNGKRVQLEDHSIFVAFAPMENPKIALAVFVENAGFGATTAGPIATLMIEKYLRGKITRTDLEKRVLAKDLRGEYFKYTGKKPPVLDTITKKETKVEGKTSDSTKVKTN